MIRLVMLFSTTFEGLEGSKDSMSKGREGQVSVCLSVSVSGCLDRAVCLMSLCVSGMSFCVSRYRWLSSHLQSAEDNSFRTLPFSMRRTKNRRRAWAASCEAQEQSEPRSQGLLSHLQSLESHDLLDQESGSVWLQSASKCSLHRSFTCHG